MANGPLDTMGSPDRQAAKDRDADTIRPLLGGHDQLDRSEDAALGPHSGEAEQREQGIDDHGGHLGLRAKPPRLERSSHHK
jgi:hypothetical protein